MWWFPLLHLTDPFVQATRWLPDPGAFPDTRGSLDATLAEMEIRNSTWSILKKAHSHCQVALGV
jgi:hypothetical protein